MAAVCQPLAANPRKKLCLRSRFVEMKGLRIEFRREGLNFLRSDARSTGAEGLPRHEIFEVSLRYWFRLALGPSSSAGGG